MTDEPIEGGPLAWNVECPCYRSEVDFREVKIHDACNFARAVPYLRRAFTDSLRYCWWVELRAEDEEADLVKAVEFLNKCLGDVRAKKLASKRHDAPTRKVSSFDP